MPKTRINCPNCRQPVVADVQQLFDLNVDPAAKQQLLSGGINIVQCPHCGYQGNLATPIVYHDPQKELLLTFMPPELNLPRDEQERVVGSLINQVVNNLPQEKRKGYLLRPQANLTLQSLVEKVLEADGITREMIQSQQQRLALLNRLMSTIDASVRSEIIQQEEQLIDAEFFALFSRIMEAALTGGDNDARSRMESIQAELMEHTEYGRKFKEQAEEIQAAIQSLQEAGKDGLTREKLLQVVLDAPNDTRVNALVSLARPAMDYQFFQLLSDKIDRARDKGRQRLIDLRERLLELTRQVDEQIEMRSREARNLLAQLLESENPAEATQQNLQAIDEIFVQILNAETESARKSGDLEKLGKLQEVGKILQQATEPPPEIALIEKLMEAQDSEALKNLLDEHRDQITPDFLQTLSSIIVQVEQSGQNPELVKHLQNVHKQAMRFSMLTKLRGG